jgi:hypothetical protein
MSGFYNYWPKVNHQDEVFAQMTSGGFQPPFFFGGSQVPTALGLDTNGMGTNHVVSTRQVTSGKGIKKQNTYHEKHKNIHLPRTLYNRNNQCM